MPVPRRFDRRPPERDTTRINERIRVPQVRLIGADGEQLGIVDTSEALRRAQDAGVVRKDIGIDDLLRLVTGVTGASFPTTEQRDRVLAIALDGLRVVI